MARLHDGAGYRYRDVQPSGRRRDHLVSGTDTNCVVGNGGSTPTTPECAELYALDIASGKIKWQDDLDDVNGLYSPYCRGNPTVVGSVIVLACGYQVDGFSRTTGAYLWQNPGTACYIASDNMASSGTTVYVSCQNGMGAIDATDGATVWSTGCSPSDPAGPCTTQIAIVGTKVYGAGRPHLRPRGSSERSAGQRDRL